MTKMTSSGKGESNSGFLRDFPSDPGAVDPEDFELAPPTDDSRGDLPVPVAAVFPMVQYYKCSRKISHCNAVGYHPGAPSVSSRVISNVWSKKR